MFPIADHPYYGIFVKEQIEALKTNFNLDTNLIFINGRKSKLNYIKSIITINFHILFRKYDCIHIHFGLSGLFTLFNPFIKCPMFLTLHSADIDIAKKKHIIIFITKLVVKRMRKVFNLNEEMKTVLDKNKSIVEILPCGVDTEFFNESENKPVPCHKVTIGFPGNKVRIEKNYSLFINIINELSNKYEVEVIEFHGMSRQEVLKSLNSLDMLLMTSISEGSPQIIKEAMACNVPIVSSNVGDVNVLLKDLDSCFIIKDFEKKSYISAITHILQRDKINRRTLGRERIHKLGLDQKTTVTKIFNHYLTAVKNDY